MTRKINILVFIGFIAVIIAGFALRYLTYDAAYINGWVTRDFDRAFNLVEGTYFPLAGSEVNNGGRLPGPFLYLLLAIPILIKSSYESIIAFNLLVNCASILGLFFVAKRFFGATVGFVSAIFLSFNLTHIGAAGFPFNPSYLFLLIPLYLWFVFELGVNRNVKFLPFIVLIVSLGIQIHYSFATFYLAPILLLFLLRLRVSLKPILLSVLLAAICFTPYSFYLKQTVTPHVEGSANTFKSPNISILERAIKFPFVANTIDKMTFKNGISRTYYMDQKVAAFYYALTLLSMLFLAWQIYIKIKEKGIQSASKEVTLFVVFYGPALIYEITNPVGWKAVPHNWYTFIFVLPQMILIAFFLVSLFQGIKKKWAQSVFVVASISIIISLGINSYADVRGSALKLKKDLFLGEFNNYKKLHATLMQTLELSPEDYVNRVYFEGFPPTSLKSIEFLEKQKILRINKKTNPDKNNEFCYFLAKDKDLKSKKANYVVFRLLNYLKDKTILRLPPILKITFNENKTSISAARYKPKNNQPCYTNGLNTFPVEKTTRDLLIKSKVLDVSRNLDMKVISRKEDYDSNNELISFKGEYLAYDQFTNSPFQLNLDIKNSDKGYIARVNIHRHYFWAYTEFVHKTDLAICSGRFQTRLKNESCTFLNIFPADSLASTFYVYNQKWGKTIQLPKEAKIIKDKHFFKLAWKSMQTTDVDAHGLYTQNKNTSVISLN
jgi:hypothetical protein